MRGKTITRDLNPKALTSNELYGFVNMATREWKESRSLSRTLTVTVTVTVTVTLTLTLTLTLPLTLTLTRTGCSRA